MKKTIVYIYVMTNDNGFAPCIDNNWLTLACCKGGKKGGMRKSAKNDFSAGHNVYLLGLCGKTLATKAMKSEMEFLPVYLAKIDKYIEMKEYYKIGGLSAGRKDDVYIYDADKDEFEPKKCNHHSEDEQKKDKGGKYVLCSHQFTYFGNKCGKKGCEIKEFIRNASEKKSIRECKSFRGYIVERDFCNFEKAIKNWDWFPKKPNCCKIISNHSISEKFVGGSRKSVCAK